MLYIVDVMRTGTNSRKGGTMNDLVSFTMCQRVVERDARIAGPASDGTWTVTLESHSNTAHSRSKAVREAAEDLQWELTKDLA